MSSKVYEVITDRITALLEQGTIPWRKPWNAQSNLPRNISGREYRGINIFLLATQQYGSPYWLTFNQVQTKGGHVRKGEKSTPVVFWKWLDKKDAEATDGENSTNGKIPMLRYYSVFNIEQTEGITPPAPEETHNHFDPITKAEKIIASMPLKPDIRYVGSRAYYSPSLDYIQLPPKHSFESAEELACCQFHELIHSTGHSNRLGRKGITETSYFGGHEYSKEELVAEMGAAFLCGHAGIENTTIQNSAAYIQGWLKALKNDKTLLIHAAGAAQKAADYILNRKPEVTEDAES